MPKTVRNSLNKSGCIIPSDQNWRYFNRNPSPPSIEGLVKIHEEDLPIRPIINWLNATAYKFAKHVIHVFEQYAPLSYSFNVKNTLAITTDLKDIQLHDGITLVSLTSRICVQTFLL